ncbi:MAG: MurR/RpiR family transcriptional regulator [Lachnospiraceae bacterium]|jgi:RpiR family carbohydrate utilization transcriptional regulator|nr:MurR/RpiR family transcriptional regulator [Lachnospiraceae bacterium]
MDELEKLITRIRLAIPTLTRAEKAVAEAILENPQAVSHLTLAQLTRESRSSDATVVRFARSIGFDGFTSMKQAFVEGTSGHGEIPVLNIMKSDDMESILKKVYQSNIQILSDTLDLADESYDQALEAMLHARSIHFFGVGDAHVACEQASMKLSRLGITSSAHEDVMMQLTTAGNMTSGDVAIAVSYEGRSRNIVECLRTSKGCGATTIGITGINKSPLLNYTDIILRIGVSDLTYGRDKVTRRVADQFILDALILGYTIKNRKVPNGQLQRIQAVIDKNKI